MKVYQLYRLDGNGLMYVYAHNEDDAIQQAKFLVETGEWKVLRALDEFTQIIYYDES